MDRAVGVFDAVFFEQYVRFLYFGNAEVRLEGSHRRAFQNQRHDFYQQKPHRDYSVGAGFGQRFNRFLYCFSEIRSKNEITGRIGKKALEEGFFLSATSARLVLIQLVKQSGFFNIKRPAAVAVV